MENKDSFDELYSRLYNENFSELEELRKEDTKGVKKILVIIGIIFFCFIVFGILMITGFVNVFNSDGNIESMLSTIVLFVAGTPLIILIMFLAVFNIIKISKTSSVVQKSGNMFEPENPEKRTYKNMFKEKIVAPIINLVLENTKYYHNSGLTKEEYNMAMWEKYDIYDSEDKIVTNINNRELVISEVHTEDVDRDSDGHTSHSTVFYGLAGYMDLPKDIGCYIKVSKNKIGLFGSPKDEIEMDMTEFEKMFDVNTDDKIKAMQILTADIMAELIQLIQTTKVKFEFYINHNKMHVRFHTGEVFEPEVFGKAMQYKNLKKYFDIVTCVKNITEHICNVISETEL